MRSVLLRFAAGRWGPTTLAVALAIVATPLVALSFLAPPIFELDETFQAPSLGTALLVAGLASAGAAVVGGTVGGFVVPRHATLGTLLALALAWPLAIVLTPLAATAIGQPFETAFSCFDTCGAMIQAGEIESGVGSYLVALFTSAVTIVPLVLLGICVFGAYRLNQSGYPFVGALVLAFGYGSMHWIAILGGAPPLVGFTSLALGVAAWAWALRQKVAPGSDAPLPPSSAPPR